MSAESPTAASSDGETRTDLEESAGELETESIATDESTTLELDQVFEILKNQRRRYVLKYLKEVDDTVSMSDLAEEIAAWENDKEVSQLSSSERKRVYVGLYQCHLPKMDSMDVVSFNKPRGRIERGANADVFDDYIDTGTESEDPAWFRIHALTAAGTAGVFALALVAQFYVAAPLVTMAGLFVVAGNLGSAAAHFNWARRNSETDEE
jgi:hypothetical protein